MKKDSGQARMTIIMDLKTSIRQAGRIYKIYANKLERLGIQKLEDLLYHIPARYENFGIVSQIAQIQQGEVVTIQGQVQEAKNEYTRRRFVLQKVTVTDGTASLQLIWFNQPYIVRTLPVGSFISAAGKVDKSRSKLVLKVQNYEILGNDRAPVHTGRLVPVYPETQGLTSKFLRNRIQEILKSNLSEIEDFLPEHITKHHNLLPLKEALEKIHFPKNLEDSDQAYKRLSFDELFLAQLSARVKRAEWEKKVVTHQFKIDPFQKKIDKLITSLPFELTNAQKKAVKEIFSDLSAKRPMNRLLQGDVGSGKTVVAAIAMYLAYLNGFQSALMAPTEILATQHYATINKLLSPFGVRVGLVTSSQYLVSSISYDKKKQNTKYEIQNTDILIGTHALIQKDITFHQLGLVVIDEQQRFGVEQRSVLRKKGVNPHFLTMTATPIPRTIFLTMYGDLEISFLGEMPKGRQIIKTWLVPEEKRNAGYEWIKKQITGNTLPIEKVTNKKTIHHTTSTQNQVFIVCPFIEESENMTTVKAAVKEFERLQQSVFKEFKLGLLHGKLKSKEKDEILKKFATGELDILVATPVVEVGIDIPNATVIVIEAAERFGLAQLHQLRGRVGRADKQSYCLLFTESTSYKTRQRLKSLERTHIGAELAEIDLQLRGPGEMYGTLQHGARSFKIASFTNTELIALSQQEAEKIYRDLQKYPRLLEKVQEVTLASISPD